MTKIFLPIFLFCLFSTLLVPIIISAQNPNGIVPCNPSCDNSGNCTGQCQITDFFQLLVNIYSFIVTWIATPLAVLALVIGGVLIMTSAGNPNLMGTGKKILYAAIIGLALVFCSWLIINFILGVIGYTGNWSVI